MSISVRQAASALACSGACCGGSVEAPRRRGGGGGICPGCRSCVGCAENGCESESGSMVMASELSSTLGSGVALSGIGGVCEPCDGGGVCGGCGGNECGAACDGGFERGG